MPVNVMMFQGFITATMDRNTNSCKSLTDLPDELLLHILTELPTKDAAKMSILSKKFKDLWKFVDVLKISQNQFRKRALFIDFVNKALSFQDRTSIKVFHLSCDILSYASLVNAWISNVIKANVEVLHLSLGPIKSGYRLPSCIFNSHSLTTLHLELPHIVEVPLPISLPNLKILGLQHVIFVDADSTKQLLSSPALEE